MVQRRVARHPPGVQVRPRMAQPRRRRAGRHARECPGRHPRADRIGRLLLPKRRRGPAASNPTSSSRAKANSPGATAGPTRSATTSSQDFSSSTPPAPNSNASPASRPTPAAAAEPRHPMPPTPTPTPTAPHPQKPSGPRRRQNGRPRSPPAAQCSTSDRADETA
jgi:hypothetical protein